MPHVNDLELEIGSLVYVAEGKNTDQPDMRFEPGRLHMLRTSGKESLLEQHAVIVRPCRQDGPEHQVAHSTHCRRVYNADLIRPAGDVIEGARGEAIIQYSDGRHGSSFFVAISDRGLVLLDVGHGENRYEWRFPPDPSTGRDRVPVTAWGNVRCGDFTVQDFDIEFDSIAPREHYTDILGKVVRFPGYSQVSDGFQGDSELIMDWEAGSRAQCQRPSTACSLHSQVPT